MSAERRITASIASKGNPPPGDPPGIMRRVISPRRLAHVFLAADGRELVTAWVEGGGQPLLRAPVASIEEATAWAIVQAAEGVVVRAVSESQGYWWGPGDEIPFNKADLLPISELGARPANAAGWSRSRRPVDIGSGGYVAYWSDRGWWSLNPGASRRQRRLVSGELEELLDKTRGLELDHADPGDTLGATDVSVSRYDMFLEGGPHLRGMIRQRWVEGLDTVFTDPEDAVNPHFHAGPPLQMTLDP